MNVSSHPLLKVAFATGCAWRAVYVSVRSEWDAGVQRPVYRQVFRLGIDPTASVPNVFGAIGFEKVIRGRLPFVSWRFPIPRIRYRYPMGKVRSVLYRWQQAALFRLDGRKFAKNGSLS